LEFGQGSGRDLVSRRGALALFGAIAAMRHAGAAEQAIMQPVALDHVNIRVPNVARTAQFYMALVDTPVLRSQTLRAQPDSPPGEGFFLRFGDGYLAISQAFAPDLPGLDHYSLGLRDYDKAKVTASLQDNGTPASARSSADVWLSDPDGSVMQLRPPGGWARQSATPYQPPARRGPAFSPLRISRLTLRTADLDRAGNFYRRLFGAEITSPAAYRSRAFPIGDAVLELFSPPEALPLDVGLDHIRIAVKDYTIDHAARILGERGIEISAAPAGAARIADPDGLRIELAAA
jgi:catechol 2,3-dioxygenase-like lactoylglutathione lyase family enzyme